MVKAVKITPNMAQFARLLARTRNDKPINVNKRFTTDLNDEHAHYISALAEVAFAEVYDLYVDIEKLPRGDGGIDFTIMEWTYQIKARDVTRFRYPDLLVRPGYIHADKFVLCDVNPHIPEVGIVGWCDRVDVENAPLDNFGYGPRHVVSRLDLKEIE